MIKLEKFLDNVISIGFIIFAVGSCVSISIAQIGIFTSLGFWIIKMILQLGLSKFFYKKNGTVPSHKFIKTELDLPLLVFAIITIIVAFFSRLDWINSLNGVVKTVGLMSIYFLVVNNIKNEKQIKLLITLIIISASLECIYGIYQRISGFRLLSDGRIAGSTGWPIFLGEILAIVISITLSFILYKVYRRNWILLLFLIPMVGCLILTLARGAWIGMFFSLILLGILKEKKIIYVGLSTLILIIAISITFPHNRYVMRLTSIVNPADITVLERINMWKTGIKIIKNYPEGIGVHNIDKVYEKYKQPDEKNWAILHSNFIQIAVERGILGLAVFLWFIVTFIAVSLRRLSLFFEEKDAYPSICKATVFGVLCGFISFIVSGVTEYNFGTSLVIQLVWFLLALSICSMDLIYKNQTRGIVRGWRKTPLRSREGNSDSE